MTDSLSPNIVLTGFMATGKSAVAQRIATLTGRTLVDLDAEIIAAHGSIPEIFRNDGEERFREIERQMVAEFAPKRNQVIATGGGTLLNPDNVVALVGAEIYALTADPDEIHERVLADGIEGRPVLAESDDVKATINSLMAERAEAYSKFTAVDTTGKSIDDVVDALRAEGATIAAQSSIDPDNATKKADKILIAVAGVAFVVALILFILVLSF